MIDFLFKIALNNVFISLVLAIVALIVGKTLKRPVLTHMLWLLVFIKLLIPPLVMVPVIPKPSINKATPAVNLSLNKLQDTKSFESGDIGDPTSSSQETKAFIPAHGKQLLFFLWLTGSIAFFLWSIFQAFRFNQLLKRESETAPPGIQSIARNAASCLGLKASPLILTTPANISPMVWWIGGRLWLVIPATLVERMDAEQLQLILSHELAHISRWDYLCRWIEWMACVCFWWNPVVWWARNNLRVNEEICCDELVLSSIKPEPYLYGDTLLKAIDILLCTPRFQMAMASNFSGGDPLKRRLKLIISKKQGRSKLLWLNACILIAAVVLLPLRIMQAKEDDNNEFEHRLTVMEKELEKTSKKLSEELSQKADYKKANDLMGKSRAAKKAQDETLQSMLQSYDPLFKKLNISREDFDELKGILADRMDEIQDTILPYTNTASSEERADFNQKKREIDYKYMNRVHDFLGEEKSGIYTAYIKRLPERSSIDIFMDSLSPENRISEEQMEPLIDVMYTARKAIYDEMGPDIDIYSSSELTEENITREMIKTKRVHDKYVEASRSVLPPEQAGQYETHLGRIRDFTESIMKTRLFMNNK